MNRRITFVLAMAVMMALTDAAFSQRRGGGAPGAGGGRGGSGSQSLPPGAFANARVVEPLQRWEYGRLELLAAPASAPTPTPEAGTAPITWRGPAGAKVQAKSLAEMAQKLGAPAADAAAAAGRGEAEVELFLWNLLGDDGWDFIDQQTLESPDGAAPRSKAIVLRFKRPKR